MCKNFSINPNENTCSCNEELGTPISRQEALEISKGTLKTAEAERVAYMETGLGKQLQTIREKAIANGMPLLSEDEFVSLDDYDLLKVKELAQKSETKKALKAAKDLLAWLEGFDLLRGAEKVKAMRKALDELEGKDATK